MRDMNLYRTVARPALALGVAALCWLAQWAALGESSRVFPHPDRIRYDGQCLTLEGKDTFIYSGSFHYFRCPKALWSERFARIKAAGFNCVDTYIPWNEHERRAPKDLRDFSQVDLKDFEDWLALAEKAGLYVIARPGPFICAEWQRGGFPGWLLNRRPAQYAQWTWFRSNDPEFTAWSKHWYAAVLPVLARHQVTRKAPGQPGVILVFLENEYDHYAMDGAQRIAAVKALAAEALAQGIEVPLVTCETDCVSGNSDPLLRRVFNARNSYPGWDVSPLSDTLNGHHRSQPDAPLMIAETQGGWFSSVWDTPPPRPDLDCYRDDLSPAQLKNLTLFAIQNGVTILNYYMLVGGSNPGERAAKDMAASYDYSAPIRECGGVGEKYRQVAAIGRMLQEHGARLARSRIVESDVTTEQKDVMVTLRQSVTGERYLFVRTEQHREPRQGTAHIRPRDGGQEIGFAYELEPFGSKVLWLPAQVSDAHDGKWLPEPLPAPLRPDHLPASITIQQVQSQPVPEPRRWRALPGIGAAPRPSLNELGVYDNRFLYYRANFTLSAEDLTGSAGLKARLTFPALAGDHVLARCNGHLLGEADAVSGDVLLVPSTLRLGKNELVLLYENSGYLKEDDWMEKEAGLRRLRLLPCAPADQPLTHWSLLPIPRPAKPEALPEVAAGFDDSPWRSVTITPSAPSHVAQNHTVVFRTRFNLTEQDLRSRRTGLSIRQAGEYGWVFVNGKQVGELHNKINARTLDVQAAAHVGTNSLAIVVSAVDAIAEGALGVVTVTWPEAAGIQPDGPLQYSECPSGALAEAQDGPTQSLPATATASSSSLLSQHRLSFQLPARPADVWVPWLVRLHAQGNGFIYLNGHDIGRFWEAGKQTDFYLPECWLNPQTNVPNVLTLILRPGAKGAAVHSAEVIPYTIYAEKR